jgi:cation transport regulator ChaC
MLHFAYGSNMHQAIMRKHAPAARPVGVATLLGHRFTITADGYASVEPDRRGVVYGMLWRLAPSDRITLDLWENVSAGLYRAEMLPVQREGAATPALVYIARKTPPGAPRPGYMECVIEAARALEFPPDYIASLQEWLPKGSSPAAHPRFGEFG